MDHDLRLVRKEISLSDLKSLIEEFMSLSADSSIELIKDKVNILLNGYACMTRRMESHYAFRARINNGSSYFDRVSDLWYPPGSVVKKWGRLNRPGQSIFYISASHEIATLEVRPKVGDMITMLRVKLKESSHLPHVMELGMAETVSQYGLSANVQLLENSKLRGVFAGLEDIEKNLKIRSMLASFMMQIVPPGQEYDYKKSVAIVEHLMLANHIDGVLFPSIAGDGSRKGGGMNMAIKPASADKLFVADHAWTAIVEDTYDTHGYVMKCIKNAKEIHGRIIDWG